MKSINYYHCVGFGTTVNVLFNTISINVYYTSTFRGFQLFQIFLLQPSTVPPSATKLSKVLNLIDTFSGDHGFIDEEASDNSPRASHCHIINSFSKLRNTYYARKKKKRINNFFSL